LLDRSPLFFEPFWFAVTALSGFLEFPFVEEFLALNPFIFATP
jgi:hypothetical protein